MLKQKLFLYHVLLNLSWVLIHAQNYPVDISFLVSDFKYSQAHGLKICEVQQGSLSAFDGDLYISGKDGVISPRIADFFSKFAMKKWSVGLIYPPLKRSLILQEWDVEHSLKTLIKDPLFLEYALKPPEDRFSIGSYGGILYADFDLAQSYKSYVKVYPGILFINASTFPYWRDKYKMNALFDLNNELKRYKADWRIYPKKYDAHLSVRIQEDMPAEFYVIKPRRECLANGVIIVTNADLDSVLQMLLEPLPSLEMHPDKKYSYWWKNKDDTFIIEKYYESDPLYSEKKCRYDATMRLAFILKSDQGILTYHCLGGFWKLPSKSLDEEGTLNEKRISCCKPPFYKAIDPELLTEVNAQMEKAMLLLYEIMLSNSHPNQSSNIVGSVLIY